MPWYKQKTTWSGLLALVGAAAGFLTGSTSLIESINIAVPAVLAIFLRQGIEKKN